jgi:hypothetical protein
LVKVGAIDDAQIDVARVPKDRAGKDEPHDRSSDTEENVQRLENAARQGVGGV